MSIDDADDDDIQITFVRSSCKEERSLFVCLDSEDEVLHQIDGQIDFSPQNSSSSAQNNRSVDDERLSLAVARVRARQAEPHRTKQIFQIPIVGRSLSRNVEPKRKLCPSKIIKDKLNEKLKEKPKEKPKERPKEILRPVKKNPTKLMTALLKTNQDTIRPLYTRITPTGKFVNDLNGIETMNSVPKEFPSSRKIQVEKSTSELLRIAEKKLVESNKKSLQDKTTDGKTKSSKVNQKNFSFRLSSSQIMNR